MRLYFLLSAVDQARIDPASIQISFGPATDPDSLHIEFKVNDPDAGAPRLRPLFAGQMGFTADVGGTLPAADHAFTFTSTEYASWQTRGTLFVNADDATVREIGALLGKPGHEPNRVWYWPVRLPETFLYGTMRTPAQLGHAKISLAAGGSLATSNAAWPGQAVAGFLGGTYQPKLRQHATTASEDDVQKFPMPAVEMAPDGTVEIWVALARSADPNSLDDGQAADVTAAAAAIGAASTDAVKHPANGALNAWNSLILLAANLVDGGAANALAGRVLPAWPVNPRFDELRFALVGSQERVYQCGALAAQGIEVRDTAGTLLQQRALPIHGTVWVPEMPGAAAPHVVDLTLSAGPLEVSFQPGGVTNTGARVYRVDFSATGGPALVSMAPVEYARFAILTHAMAESLTTKTATRDTLAAHENEIRPTGWRFGLPTFGGGANDIFVGSRRPWIGWTAGEVDQFLAGLGHVTIFGTGALPTVKPQEAVLLWILEGKIAAVNFKGFLTPARPKLRFRTEIPGFTATQVNVATEDEIKTLVRVWACWNWWGLDDMNHHSGTGDNPPVLTGDLPLVVMQQDDAFEAGRIRMTDRGLNPPGRATVNDAFEVSKVGSDWDFRIAPNHIETMVWLQYSEFLRRLTLLAIHLSPPGTGVWDYPVFGYMSYNGGFEDRSFAIDLTKTVFREWADATARMGTAGCAYLNPQDALRCEDVTTAEVNMLSNGGARGSSRLNSLLYGALWASYAKVWPIRTPIPIL